MSGCEYVVHPFPLWCMVMMMGRLAACCVRTWKRSVADAYMEPALSPPSLQRLINGVISEPPEILGLTTRDTMSLLPALTQLSALLQEEKASVPPSPF